MIGDKPAVYVVDDDPLVVRGLERLLSSKGLRVCAFSSAEEFLANKMTAEVACLLLDVHLPGVSGLDLQVLLSQRKILLPIIFITGFGSIPAAVHSIRSGAVSYLTKPFSENDLMREIEDAFAICRKELRQRSEVAQIQQCYGKLTEREREILTRVTTGKLNKQTAAELGIVENTVKVHRRRVMKKMQAESVAELVLMVQRLDLPPQNQGLRAY